MKWIPITKRMPEEYKNGNHMISDLVLVTVKDYEEDDLIVCDDITINGKWVNFDSEDYEVTAWKPLPKPYKD